MMGSRISIPSILKVGSGTLGEIGKYLKENEFHSVVVFFGNGLIDMFGATVMESLKVNDIKLLDYRELDSTDINDIVELAFGINTKTQAILGIGGGKVIDVAKYAAYLRKMPFISIPTSASSDGFSSSSASLLVEGKRTSVPARLAYGIIVDTDVIKSAPDKFIYSGIGDLVSKITALYDWLYEDKQGYDTLNDFAMMIAKKAVNSFVRTSFESNSIKDDLFLRELVDSLALSGIANEIAGNSAPSSGSEHLISHALDKILEVPQLHGIQVGLATYLMSLVQNHRYKRIRTIFTNTGFFDYAATLGLEREDFMKAIDLAPSIKPYRHTYIHEEQYRELAKKILCEDEVFQRIFGSESKT
ncbi:MAG: iron-containing alcohol dehydrogenase family protein [Lachnospiraceae bacterium]|nr:iron-containing alcohol dehydrogenase family protein [Lachnospiraceae bacterium]